MAVTNKPAKGVFACLIAVVAAFAAPAVPAASSPARAAASSPAAHSDHSAPLVSLHPAPNASLGQPSRPLRALPRHPAARTSAITAQPSVAVPALMPTTSTNFEGIGMGFSGPAGGFTVNSAPPDSNAAVGPNHVVEMVNSDFAVFNRSGAPVFGPVPTNTLWSGFGAGCQTNNDGDGTVAYDRIADRWVLAQFSVTTTPFTYCVAVSQTGDPTGAYNRYSFSYGNTDFIDYPKLSVWPDAYYTTYNVFAGSTFTTGRVCAFDRVRMLAGQPASQQCFDTSANWGGLLPSDLDGTRLPPAGAPNTVAAFGTNSLGTWRFHVDWTTPGNSTLTGPVVVAVAAFSDACGASPTIGTCIPQAGTTQQLDSLGDRLMYRLAYRNFGDHESLVASHSITAGSSVGVRWYELRPSSGVISIFQQGTYAPDSNYRWMGSIAQDSAGDMALGFSLSGTGIVPQIHYTGRLAADPLGQMPQGEGTIIDGAGFQGGGTALSRWGDYTSMSIDPVDDCTFWYTNQYQGTNGTFNWHTRIASFKFPNCGAVPNDFSISANPNSLSMAQGGSGTSSISTAVTSGSAATVSLSASAPAGLTATLNPTSVTAGGSATLTVTAGSVVTPGTYTVTATGTEGSTSHSTTVTVTVTGPPPPNDFSISANPTSLSMAPGGSGTSSISTAVTSGSAGSVSLSASAPTGLTAALSPTSVTAGGASTLTVTAGSAIAPGTYTVTVTGSEGSATHSTSVMVTITAPPPPNDFSISANPTSLSMAQGGSGSSTISTAVTSGSAGGVTLSASAPTGLTAALSPTSVTAGGSSTLTVTAGTAIAPGTYSVTVTGAEGSATHSTSVSVTVTSVPSGIVNGGFETGTLAGWMSVGSAAVVTTTPHSGSYAAQVGSTSPFNGDSSIAQTFAAPPAGGTLSFYYKVVCPDTVTYDWATATLRDNTAGGTVTTVLPKTCTNSGAWVNRTAAVIGGHSYTLTLIDHDDNFATDPTYTLFDDVSIVAPAPPPPAGITNGGFETGTLAGWTSLGSAAVVTTPHSGSYSAQVGSTSAFSGDSSIAQTFTAPAAGGTLSFYYQVHCTDTVTYDWATATLRDNTAGGTVTTVLPKTCTNAGAWVNGTAALIGGHSYTLTLIDHDDGFASDPTYTLFDDVAILGPPPPPPTGITNGGFETGSLAGWTAVGSTAVVTTTPHSGTFAAQVGSTSAFNGDSSIAQTFVAPAAGGTLSFYYKVVCTDTVTYDWALATLRDNTSGGTVTTVLPKTCSNAGAWVNRTATLTVGHSYTLTLTDHDDNFATDPTYTLFDDVVVS